MRVLAPDVERVAGGQTPIMPEWLQAGEWGLLAGFALVLGALPGYTVRMPQWLIASVMAFGAGVLMSAVSFELIDEAHRRAGLAPTVVGAVSGAVLYTVCNMLLARRGRARARGRRRQQHQQRADDRDAAVRPGHTAVDTDR